MYGSTNITRTFFSFCFSVPGDPDLVRTVKIMAILLVGGFAVFGNILIIFLAAKFTVKRNIHHLIMNMAVADILVAIIFSYEIITSAIDLPYLWNLWDNQVIANILCKSFALFIETSKFVTLITLLVLSVERFRSTKLTVHRVRPYTLKKRLTLVSSSWLLSMGLSAYKPLYNEIQHSGDTLMCCSKFTKTNFRLYSFSQVCVLLMVCLVVIFNIMTSFRIWKSRQTFQGNLSYEQNRTRGKRTAKAVKMVLCSLLLYTCCYLPSFLFEFFFAFYLNNVFSVFQPNFFQNANWGTLTFLRGFVFIVNSLCSPCIYIVFLTEFKQAAKRILQ